MAAEIFPISFQVRCLFGQMVRKAQFFFCHLSIINNPFNLVIFSLILKVMLIKTAVKIKIGAANVQVDIASMLLF